MRSTSTASALRGDTYSTRVVGSLDGDRARPSIAQRNAANVLPDPVGAMTRVLSPSAMAFQACACAGVGSTKVPANHSQVSALKRSSELLVKGTRSMVPRTSDNSFDTLVHLL